MSTDKDDARETARDSAMDALVRAARPTSNREFVRPSEEEIWAYLSGTATELQAATMRQALGISETFRREFGEMAEEFEQIALPVTRKQFDRARPSRVPSRSHLEQMIGGGQARRREKSAGLTAAGARIAEFLWGLARRPAFAYAFMLVIMSYPTYRWLSERKDTTGGTNPVLSSQSMFVRSDTDLSVRGAAELPRLALDSATALIDVTIWAPASLRINDRLRFAATVADERGVVWKTEDFRGLISLDGQYAFRLSISRRALRPGIITIRIDPTDPQTPGTIGEIQARFRITGD